MASDRVRPKGHSGKKPWGGQPKCARRHLWKKIPADMSTKNDRFSVQLILVYLLIIAFALALALFG
jgi:hypothetical protein